MWNACPRFALRQSACHSGCSSHLQCSSYAPYSGLLSWCLQGRGFLHILPRSGGYHSDLVSCSMAFRAAQSSYIQGSFTLLSLYPWNVTAQQKMCVSSSTWKTQYWEQDPAFCRCLINTCWVRERIKRIFGEHGVYGEDGIWMWDWRCKHFKLVV